MPTHRPFALLAALILTTIALAQDIPLQNPGFEDGKRGWSDDKFPELIAADNKLAHTGNLSLRITSPRGTENPYTAQSVADLRAGAVYAFRAFVHTDGVAVPSLAALKIEFYNAAGENTSGYYQRLQPPANGLWVPIEVRAPADADTTRATLLLRLFGAGSVWFDDVTFLMVEPPKPVALAPARQVVLAGKDRTFSVLVRLADAWDKPGDPPLKFSLLIPGKEAPYAPEVSLKAQDASTFQATLQMPTMAPGAYALQCTLEGAEAAGVARVFVPVEKRKPANLSDTGNLLVDRKPFFPIGLYHVGTADYTEVAKHGFNCVQGSATLDLKAFAQSLDQAKRERLMVDVPFYADGKVAANMPASLKKVSHYHTHLAVLDWKIIDEPDLRPDVIDEVPGAYQALRTADPNTPLLLTIASPASFAYWANFCDVLQVDPYPLPNQPLTMVADTVRQAKAALQPWQNLTVVLQAGWTANPMNQPTYDQARVMLYLALVNGARGVFWYSMRDPGWDLTQTPLWTRFEEINKETATLAHPIMQGTEAPAVKIETIGEGLQWLARDFEGKTYILLVNPGAESLRATIDPGREVTTATTLQGATPAVGENKVVVDMLPTSAETVVIPSAAAAPPKP